MQRVVTINHRGEAHFKAALLTWINADAELHEVIALVIEKLSSSRDASSSSYSTFKPDVHQTSNVDRRSNLKPPPETS